MLAQPVGESGDLTMTGVELPSTQAVSEAEGCSVARVGRGLLDQLRLLIEGLTDLLVRTPRIKTTVDQRLRREGRLEFVQGAHLPGRG